jgi:hypothetical protein
VSWKGVILRRVFSPEEFERYGWLAWAVDRAPGWACDDAELIRRLSPELAGGEREETLRELERRVVIWEPLRIAELAQALTALEERQREPGRAAQNVDRLLQRLLHRVSGAEPLAMTCLLSGRNLRRRAAWRFYGRHGFDAEVASVLAEQLRTRVSVELLGLVAPNADVLRSVPLGSLLATIDAFYWRGRVLETLLVAGCDAEIGAAAAAWPGEAIFAIRRAGRSDLADLVGELLDEHPNDPEVITGAIQTFGIFGRTDDMLNAAALGERVLALAAQNTRERLGVELNVMVGRP